MTSEHAKNDAIKLIGELVEKYRETGYVVLRNFLSTDEVQATNREISRVIDDWYTEFERTGQEGPDWEEVVNRDPLVRSGELHPIDRLHSVRRLFRISVHLDYFKRLASHPKMLAISRQLLGDNVKLLQSMALLKPPGTAEKRWHQDNGYFRLIPNHLLVSMNLNLSDHVSIC
jgi:ectoine hydroxylase-related dioxygenase (phytanoyl-CoA dioxygenase family)